MSIITEIINSVLRGENKFCPLCFKRDQNMVFHSEINIKVENKEHFLALSDVFQSLFGREVQNFLDTFENICEDCLSLTIGIYTYIQSCHSNANSLVQALEALDNSLDGSDKESETNKSLFVSLNLSDYRTELLYDEKKIKSSDVALRRFNFLTMRNGDYDSSTESITKKKTSIHIKVSDMLLDPNDQLPKCKQCLKTYPSLYLLRTHFLHKHALKKFKCTKCSKAFSSPELVAKHVSTEHCEIICSVCGKEFNNKSTFIRHEMSHTLKIVCPDCGRMYKSTVSYKRHIESNLCKQDRRADPANAQYTCDYCGKKYTQKMSLRVHIQYFHGNYKAHECQWCNKKFWAQSRLKAHIVKHTKEKKFVCSICQGKFVTKESLLYHSRLHSGEKPYRCTECNCSFISSSRRTYHMKTYHLKASVECETCHAKFSSRRYLDKHKKLQKQCQNIYVTKQTRIGNTENGQTDKLYVNKNPDLYFKDENKTYANFVNAIET